MDDLLIIRLYIERSEEAIAKTAKKYGNYLGKISWNILANQEDVEECVNDTYLTAWNQIPPDRPLKFLPYLGRIIRSLSLNRYNYLHAAKRNHHFDEILDELNENSYSTNKLDDDINERVLVMTINDFLEASKKEHRVVFVRRYWFNESISEIAQHRRISQSKVKSILYRMRTNLKNKLVEEGIIGE